MNKTTASIDAFLSSFPEATKYIMENIRATIKKAAPMAEEAISYGIPTFKYKGNLVHFSAYKNHIGFYPGAAAITHFYDELKKYKHAKGSVQFPLSQPIPYDLITKITQYRVAQNNAK